MRNVEGVLKPYGEISVMAVNQLLLQNLLQKNPGLTFALEESFPLKATYTDASPLGPLMELRASDQQNALGLWGNFELNSSKFDPKKFAHTKA